MTKDISNLNQIEMYLHCGLCLKELPKDTSPAEYQDVAVGWTKQGIQVWCNRHQANMLHIDFEGQTHPANTTRSEIGQK